MARLTGTSGNDSLVGGADSDRLIGGAGDDTLVGDKRANSIEGHGGADLLDGGEGADHLQYTSSIAGVRISFADSTASGGFCRWRHHPGLRAPYRFPL